jgi:predicted dehydrogenase
MTISDTILHIGIVGAGGFASFAAKCFVMVEGIKIVAVADTNHSSAINLAGEFGATAYHDLESLLTDDRVDLVYIATPPSLHFQQSKSALLAGKHVICEKPAALSTQDAETLVELAQAKNRLYVVNLMQRYNPLYSLVKQIIDQNILGEFTHGYFENYACDEFLDESHWFWNDDQSGGIFIEHGVHFFDLFSGWLGDGKLIYAAKWQRPGVTTGVLDRVMALVNYPKGPVSFYHGFDQPKALDRQEMRLQFERGDVTLYGWVPVRLRLTGLLDKSQIEDIRTLLPEAEIGLLEADGIETTWTSELGNDLLSGDPAYSAKGRFKAIGYDHHVIIRHGADDQKMGVYADLLKKMIEDQRAWILDNTVRPITNGINAVESLRIAEIANENAIIFPVYPLDACALI